MANRQAVEAFDRIMQDIIGVALPFGGKIMVLRIRLTLNMRAHTDPRFSEFLLKVGDGDEDVVDESFFRILDDMTIPYTDKGKSKDALIDAIFPSLQINEADSDYIILRVILSTKNENIDEINDQLIDKFSGDEKIYYSFNEAEDDKNNIYPMEFLNSLIDIFTDECITKTK
ncbi:uncharacterized protein LOC112510803 [Cynara cardunculus var. scolymus]|uniref:uncharacterized protein LOC112510803 n=1 Tax=Cynara cardunculus var. scolymus TaxID=59895 RepID=UPI000D6257E3|nr:uncharacterized protein LOC112510803 [Cynara cardunculus var. scolymus]